MAKLNQRAAAHILLLVTAIGIIALTLVTNTFSFKDKLFSQLFPKSKSFASQLYESTPLNELSMYPKASNNIQLFAYFGVNKFQQNVPQFVKDYLAKEMDFFLFDFQHDYPCIDSGNYDFPCPNNNYNFSGLWNLTSDLKAILPNKLKVIIHGCEAFGNHPWCPSFPILTDNDIMHNKDSSIKRYILGSRLFNVNNPTTRDKIALYWRDTFNTKNVDGVVFDSFNPDQAASLGRGSCLDDTCDTTINPASFITDRAEFQSCLEGPCETYDFWTERMGAFGRETMNSSPGREVIYNGFSLDPNSKYGPYNSNFTDYFTGALIEYPQEMIFSPEKFKNYLDAINYILNKGKKLFIIFQPQLSSIPSLNINLNLERFFLATYLLLQKNSYTFFSYHPGEPYRLDSSEWLYFYKDWNLDFGTPLDFYRSVNSPDLYYRQYSNGYAVVNSSDFSVNFPFPPGEWREWDPYDSSKGVSGSTAIPPKTGKFFFEASKFPTPSPTPPPKIGDINGDGAVNVVDFSILLSKWNTADIGADLNGDGIVNVVDFSILLSNWGT